MTSEAAQRPSTSIAEDEIDDQPLANETWGDFLATRDPDLRMRLINAHLNFTRMLTAKIYARRQGLNHPFEDYLHCAITALIQCVDRYNPARGASFKTYAQYRIEGAILNDLPKLSEQHAQVALVTNLRKERLGSLTDESPAKKTRRASFEEMVELAVGLSIGYMLEDYGMYSDEKERIEECNGYNNRALAETRDLLRELVELLPEKEKMVVKQHYFFGLGIEEIGGQMHLSKGRVSQLHKQSLKRLREMAVRVGLSLNL